MDTAKQILRVECTCRARSTAPSLFSLGCLDRNNCTVLMAVGSKVNIKLCMLHLRGMRGRLKVAASAVVLR